MPNQPIELPLKKPAKPQPPIIRNLPRITPRKAGRPALYPFSALELGDAIRGPMSMVCAASHYKKRNPLWNYACQEQPDGSWLLQRIDIAINLPRKQRVIKIKKSPPPLPIIKDSPPIVLPHHTTQPEQ